MVRSMWEKRNFQLVRSCLSGQCCVCVSELSSLELELGLAELGYFGKVRSKLPYLGIKFGVVSGTDREGLILA